MAQLAGRLPKWGCEFERRSQNGHPLGLLEVTSPMPFENPFGLESKLSGMGWLGLVLP